MTLLTELRCSVCGGPYLAYRPTRDEQDKPCCPACKVTDFEQVKRMLGYDKPKATAANVPQETNDAD